MTSYLRKFLFHSCSIP